MYTDDQAISGTCLALAWLAAAALILLFLGLQQGPRLKVIRIPLVLASVGEVWMGLIYLVIVWSLALDPEGLAQAPRFAVILSLLIIALAFFGYIGYVLGLRFWMNILRRLGDNHNPKTPRL